MCQPLRRFNYTNIDPAHQNDASLAIPIAQQPQDLDAVHLRHDQVEQNKVRIGIHEVEERLRVPRHIAFQAHCLGQCRHDLANDPVVVDYQNPVARRHHFSMNCGQSAVNLFGFQR